MGEKRREEARKVRKVDPVRWRDRMTWREDREEMEGQIH